MSYKKYFIGEVYKNKTGLEYKIIGYIPTNNNGRVRRRIQFLKSNYVTEVYTDCIKSGEIRDLLSPSIVGIGINDIRDGTKHPLYNRWASMIRRCYNTNDAAYSLYGGVGVVVSDRWHKFSNYIEDVSKKDNYDKLIKEPELWHLDKDILKSKCYSNETTIIVSETDNVREMNTRNKFNKVVLQYDKQGNLVNRFNSLSEACNYIGVSKNNLSSACLGRRKTCKGYIWKYE